MGEAASRAAAGRHTRRSAHRLASATTALWAGGAARWSRPVGIARAAPQPNILLITIDTLRADHCGPGGRMGSRTPVLDRLAAQGTYSPAYVQLPQTNPNHTTILTGTYVQTHGLRSHLLDKARASVPLLSELLKQAGYRTAAIVSWFSFDDELSGLGRGWDTFEDFTIYADSGERVPPGVAVQLFQPVIGTSVELDGKAGPTTDGVLRWLDDAGMQADQPWFLWVHYQDPHHPYTPPPPFDALPDTGADFDGTSKNLGRIGGGYKPTPAERARLLAAYDGEIAYTDSQVGRIVDRLDQRGLTAKTITVVTGDHGEAFLEHGDWLHGLSLYEACVRVPLIFRYAGDAAAVVPGRTLATTVQSADIAPTVLELAGLRPPPTMEGRSLAPLLAGRGENGPARASWGTLFDDSRMYVVSGDWKLIRRNESGGQPADELYHLPSDPGETANLLTAATGPASRMIGLLEAWVSAKGASKLWQPWAGT